MKFRLKLMILVAGVTVLPMMVIALVFYLNGINLLLAGLPSPGRFFAMKKWITEDLPIAWKNGVIGNSVESLPLDEDVVVIDTTGRIMLSTNSELRIGEIVLLTKLYTLRSEEARIPGGLHHPVVVDGQVVGIVFQFPAIPQDLAAKLSGRFEGFLVYLSVTLVIAIVIIVLITRSLRREIGSLQRAASRVASGDLEFQLTPRGNDEITALTRSFESMRRTLKEEQARRSRFLMAVSHDLKTPLTAIKGYIEAITDGMATEPEALQSHLSIITDKSKLLETRINELIDHVRMSTGQWQMKQRPIKIQQFLTEMGKTFQADASIFQREFSCQIDLPEGIELPGDQDLLTRALDNLFHNALRYTKEGNSIWLLARMEGSEAVITFQDSGPGVVEEDLELIFEPLYRGTSSRREAGMGLGLSTVRSIIEAHGWTIEASMPPGKGLTFVIRAEA